MITYKLEFMTKLFDCPLYNHNDNYFISNYILKQISNLIIFEIPLNLLPYHSM